MKLFNSFPTLKFLFPTLKMLKKSQLEKIVSLLTVHLNGATGGGLTSPECLEEMLHSLGDFGVLSNKVPERCNHNTINFEHAKNSFS